MALEDLTGTDKFVDDLVETNPVGATDGKNQGDDHIRGLKQVIKNCFPTITGAVSATLAEINTLGGISAFVISWLGLSDAAGGRALLDAEQADAAIVKSDETENFIVGYTTDLEDLGVVASGSVILDLTTENIKKLTCSGDFTLTAPLTGNGYCELKITNGGAGPHTITESGFTTLSGTRNTTDGGIDLWRVSRIDGVTYLEIVNVS